jgi:hypothetical protein
VYSIEERRENLKLAYHHQGYLVVSCNFQMKIGQVLDASWAPYLFEDQPFQVIAAATLEDHNLQVDFLAAIYGERFEQVISYLYKVVTE